MRIFFPFIALLCITFGCGDSQEDIGLEELDCLALVDSIWSMITLDQPPVYLDNGVDGFEENLLTEIKYPREARENGVEGIARIDYEVTTNGTVENIIITEDPGTGIGEELKRSFEVVTTGIAYSPAILNEVPIRVKKELELNFRVE